MSIWPRPNAHFKKSCTNAWKTDLTTPPSKKGVKRIFIRKEKPREIINFHKVLFFYSQNGRPDEKEEEQKKDEAGARL